MTNDRPEPEPELPRDSGLEDPADEPWPEWTMHQQRRLLRAWECLATMHLPDPEDYGDDYYPQLYEEGYVEESEPDPGDEGPSE